MKAQLIAVTLVLLCFAGCSKDRHKSPAKLTDPEHTVKAATHVVELYKIQIGAQDFGPSNNPLPLKVIFKEDGRPVAVSTGTATFDGRRGERFLEPEIQWVVDFDPQKNYQICLEEQSMGVFDCGELPPTAKRCPTKDDWQNAINHCQSLTRGKRGCMVETLYNATGVRVSKEMLDAAGVREDDSRIPDVSSNFRAVATRTWTIPGTPKIGYWPVADDSGHIAFGQDSYLEFRDKVAE